MSAIATKVASKLLKDRAEQYQPADPHYEYYEENGKKKKKRRGVPDGLSKKDAKILKKIRKRAHYLDKGMNICGFRVGWTFFIGDVANALLNYTLVYKPSKKLDLPSDLTHKMLFNNAISAGVGLVPVAGDIFLAAWKANSRNAHLVEAYLTIRGQEYLASLNQGSSTIPPAGMEGVQASALRSFFLGRAGEGGVQTYGSMEDVGATAAAPGQGQGRVQGPPVTAPRPAVAGAPAVRR